MARNVARLYQPSAPESEVTRYDLPDEKYTQTVGGINGDTAHLRATDALSGREVPVHVLSQTASALRVQILLSDSPRVLVVDEAWPPRSGLG